jgi:hypothetical protein
LPPRNYVICASEKYHGPFNGNLKAMKPLGYLDPFRKLTGSFDLILLNKITVSPDLYADVLNLNFGDY